MTEKTTPFAGKGAKRPKINETAVKVEEGGYLGARPPKSMSCNARSFAQPCGARRTRAFAQAFAQCNKSWPHSDVEMEADVKGSVAVPGISCPLVWSSLMTLDRSGTR